MEAHKSKVAIIGANGQVGSEVCLYLRDSKMDLVPISRNRLGSCFLRYSGFRCRHGLLTHEAQAKNLLGDCNVVANFALSPGRSKEDRLNNQNIIENSIRKSPPGARIIYFSSMTVYGDLDPGTPLSFRSAYGREKLHGENFARKIAKSENKLLYVFRLGHVCGDLQNITLEIRKEIEGGLVCLPDDKKLSNTVYTATIADAISRVAAGKLNPGTYDLISNPQWTWRQVYELESEMLQKPVKIIERADPESGGAVSAVNLKSIARQIFVLFDLKSIKEMSFLILKKLPSPVYARLEVLHLGRRASAEIAALQSACNVPSNKATKWPTVDHGNYLDMPSSVEEIRGRRVYNKRLERYIEFPDDLEEYKECV